MLDIFTVISHRKNGGFECETNRPGELKGHLKDGKTC